ncbi:MAG TPA: Coenzyme F420 hydrogenase/dehydrogenase, beta subunit C-terminal domain [Acidimicrobiales bacterium]|jgi:coenzyme F420 hydrogenase subunit beta|nr:Coenzyme F420 hydrogenase/dehydrogenase, beta subunit C-terminal domain [Acidimicrobiales bacterium]
MAREILHWKHLFDEVVTSGLCTGCAGCVVACPHDVLSYDDTGGVYRPFHIEEEGGPGGCGHGDRGCTSCTRACPRFRSWEPEIDTHLFGRARRPDEVDGISKDIILARAADPEILERGQDGGLVSAILIWAIEHGYIDAALVSYLEGDGSTWKAIPGVARTKDEILAAAGSRYTYSANTMAYAEAVEKGAEKLALVGMSCQSSVPPVMTLRKAGKPARRFVLNIGLLCSKTFDDAIFTELLEAKYGLRKQDMVKMNIKGVLQIWMRDGSYHEVPLKECHAWTREGCKMCPDFAAEHADISTGGIGAFGDWTLTVVRTDLGREIIVKMLEDGTIEGRPGDDDPGAIALLRKLSTRQRKRWPEAAVDAPRLIPPPPPKAPEPAPAAAPAAEPAAT